MRHYAQLGFGVYREEATSACVQRQVGPIGQ